MTIAELTWRPPYAYIPGQTPRHAACLFDGHKYEGDTATAKEIAESCAWQLGLLLLRDGYYWECHEVLESLWIVALPNSTERRLVQGIIQLANAGLKLRMERPRAADRLFEIGGALISEVFDSAEGQVLGLSMQNIAEMRHAVFESARF